VNGYTISNPTSSKNKEPKMTTATAEARKQLEQNCLMMAELQKIRAEVYLMHAEINKMKAETEQTREKARKIGMETFFYPFVTGASFFAVVVGAVVAAMKLFI
jgi:hypothetical protein